MALTRGAIERIAADARFETRQSRGKKKIIKKERDRVERNKQQQSQKKKEEEEKGKKNSSGNGVTKGWPKRDNKYNEKGQQNK